jgi:arylsulfatase A-like enzyme
MRRGMARGAWTARWLPILSLILSLLSCTPTDGGPPTAIILISLDTLRADYLNLYGHSEFETSPFLDSFAADNVVFDSSIVVEPRTLTSHISLMTGLYPHRHKVQDETKLPVGIRTLASELKAHGYRTGGFADGAYLNPHWGISRGFVEYRGSETRGFAKIIPEAVDWLERNGEGKFFLFLHTYDVHSKRTTFPFYFSPAPYRGTLSQGLGAEGPTADPRSLKSELSEEEIRFVRARYAEGVRYVDEQLKLFFQYLKQKGIYERALIVLWSDHGDGLFDHEIWSHGEVYEHTVRTPLIMKIPGVRARRVSQVVSAVDVMPTILDLAGVPLPATADGSRVDGRTLVPYIDGEEATGEAYAIRTKKGVRLFSIRSGSHHLLWDGNLDQYSLFNVAEDPGEVADLYPTGSEIEQHLRSRLQARVAEHDRAFMDGEEFEDTETSPEVEAQLEALGYLE